MVSMETALNRFIQNAQRVRREYDEPMYQLNKRVGGSPFTAGYSTSVLRWGGSNLPAGLGKPQSFMNRETALEMSSVVADPEGHGGGIFRVMERQSAEYGRTGFSHLVVGRDRFRQVMDIVGDDVGRQREAIEALLTYTDASLQTEVVGREGRNFVDTTRSRNITAPGYIKQQAASIQKMLRGEITADQMRNAFVFDIETAGLSDEAGIRQIAYTRTARDEAGNILRDKAGRRIQESAEILFDNPLMDMGDYPLPGGGTGSFREYMAAQRGVGVEDLNFRSLKAGLQEFFEAVASDDVRILMGQNVSFDIEKLLAEGQKVAEFADAGFQDVFNQAKHKMLGDTAVDVVDTRRMMDLGLDHIVDPTGIGGGRAFSQEAVSGFTSLLEDARRQGLLADETWEALVRTGLHDAAVDIDVTRAIGVLQYSILRGDEGAEQLMRQISPTDLDPAIRKSLENAGALLPTTSMPGETGTRTPLTSLVQGSRSFRTPTGALDFHGLLYEGSRYNYQRLAAPTRDAFQDNYLASGKRSRGFYNPDFTPEINGRHTELYVGEEAIESPTLPGTTVQERLARMNAPFAHLSEPERMIGELLNQSSVGHRASRFAADFGTNYFSAFRVNDSGRFFTGALSNVGIDPRILRAADEFSGGGLLKAVRTGKGGIVTRLSPVNRHDKVAVLLDLFQEGQEEAVTDFVGGLRSVVQGITEKDEDALKALKNAGYSDDEIRRLAESMDIDAFTELDELLRDPSMRRWGVQIGIYDEVPDAARWIQALTPERDEARHLNRLFGQYLTDLPTGPQGTASLPIQGIEALLRQVREGQQPGAAEEVIRVAREASEELQKIHSNALLAGDAERQLSEHLGSWWNRSVAESARVTKDFGRKAHRLTSAVQNTLNRSRRGLRVPRNRWMLGAAVVAGVTGASLAREEEPFDRTLVQGAYGYERSDAYSGYKAALGETAQADYATNPVVRRPPTIDTVGIVQDAHDNRTGHHNMDRTTKYAHLFGY